MMNREIKFRAWDYHQILEKWYMRSWHEIKSNCMAYFSNPEKFGQKNPNKERHIIMQFTGLKDKNGIDIYEGDIVNIPYNRIGSKQVIYLPKEVKFSISGYNLNVIEVIGNIHENPELL